MDRPLVLARRAAALAAVTVILAGCARQPEESSSDPSVLVYDIFLVASAALFLVAAGLIGWGIVRHRTRDGGRETSTTHESIRVELLWWALPTLLVIVLFILAGSVTRP